MIQICKPYPDKTGFKFTFSLGFDKKDQEPAVFVSAIKQADWVEKNGLKYGTYEENRKDPTKTLNVKFNEFEIGGLIYSLRSGKEFTTVHKYNSEMVSISLTKNSEKSRFYMSLSKDKNKFYISITENEAVALAVFFQFALERIYAIRFKKQQERQQQKPQASA